MDAILELQRLSQPNLGAPTASGKNAQSYYILCSGNLLLLFPRSRSDGLDCLCSCGFALASILDLTPIFLPAVSRLLDF